ncbi:GSCFA domain-containing protein [Dysgonomonas sp. 520]|uniref:GSCFA domain-containing protein n=1 Tax=Dysgonomonas sp. 520 TaxID=2302931 RepID=UPI0013D6433D|nr:GSCFA domain-containing protein [Dysgonomonas sp. 520]NDW10541.1 GSCFA domain protein [Dysgonomonas sp. 520]
MDFRTEIELQKVPFGINHQSKLLLTGSCFVENIGRKLSSDKFDVMINPFGILYNPLSIAQSLHTALSGKIFDESDIFQHNGLFHSFQHHGDFSDIDPQKSLAKINNSLLLLRDNISSVDVCFITFGTSFVYFHNATNGVVANCHKLPAKEFTRRRVDLNEIVTVWNGLIESLRKVNPKIRLVFTVSPIRHWSDGAHDNQLSKAILLLAIDQLMKENDDVYYFPSYELVLDDLRDYRFYAEDMLHPNDLAISYIWEKFGEMFFENDTKQIVKEWNKLKKAIEHKPLNPESDEYQQFLKQTLLKLSDFCNKYPYFYCENEIKQLNNKLSGK